MHKSVKTDNQNSGTVEETVFNLHDFQQAFVKFLKAFKKQIENELKQEKNIAQTKKNTNKNNNNIA